MKNVKDNGSALHLYGLLSDGGVHSHITHLFGLLEMAKKEGLDKVYVHCFLDGRDTAPTSGKGFIEELEAKMKEIGVGEIATINGRYYAMDRDNRWDRVEKAYKAITEGVGETADSAVAAIDASYAKDVTDEFVVPTVIMKMVLQLQPYRITIPLSSLTSVLTEQERLPEHSVQMSSTDLTEAQERT